MRTLNRVRLPPLRRGAISRDYLRREAMFDGRCFASAAPHRPEITLATLRADAIRRLMRSRHFAIGAAIAPTRPPPRKGRS